MVSVESVDPLVKPRLRGALHMWGAVVATAAGAVLVANAPTPTGAFAASIFSLSVILLLGVSAMYHRPTWKPRARAWMRRADHTAILLLIGGTYTAVALLALTPDLARRVLVPVWIGIGLGTLQTLFWIRSPKALTAAMYLVLGWMMVPYLGEVRASLSATAFALMAAGGVAYSAGALAYATKRPNPIPNVFGYHEVFHALTLAGCAFHFLLVRMLVQRAVA